MLRILIAILLIFPINGKGQITSTFDVIGGIEYSYRNLSTDSDDQLINETVKRRNQGESSKFNWRFGFNYNKRLSGKIFLKTGLRLASVGYEGEKKTDLRWPSEITPQGWIPDPSLPHENQNIYDFWFAEIPIAARMEFNNNRFTPFIEAGLSPHIYLTTKIKSINEFETESDFYRDHGDYVNEVHLVSFISFGINYSVNGNFQLFGQPTFRFHLTPTVDGIISEKLFNYGVELGIRKILN